MAKKLIQVVYQVNDAALLKAAGSLKANEEAAKKADDQVKKYGKDAEAAGNQAGKSFLNLGNIWKGLIAIGIVTFVGNLAKKTFELGVKQEQLNIAFTTFLGSAEKARKLLAELNKFALVTPFTPDQVNNAAKALLAFGVAGDKIIPTLKLLGDVSAGTGKDLTEMAIIFGQIKSTGRLMGQDLLQLINAGFNPLQVISEKTGKSMKLLKEEMEKGLISFDMVEKAFIDATSAGGLFFNLMEKQSKSVGGLLSTVQGNIDEILKNLFNASTGPIKDFVNVLVDLSTKFLQLSKSQDQLEQDKVNDSTELAIKLFNSYNDILKNTNAAEIASLELLIKESAGLKLRNDEMRQGINVVDGLYKANADRIQQIQQEIDAIFEHSDALEKADEAGKLKKVTAEMEKQAEAAKKLAKIKLTLDEKPLEGMDEGGGRRAEDWEVAHGIAKEGEMVLTDQEKAEMGVLGFLLADADTTFDAWLETLKSQQEQEQLAKDLAAIGEIEAEKKKQDKIKELKMQAFDFGVDLLGQVLFANLEANNRQEKEMTEAQKRSAENEKKIMIKQMFITTLLNAIKALAIPKIPPGLNFVQAGIATAFGLASIGIAKATPAFAEGGLITGPGSGTSDSIPIMASNREFITNAEATGNSRNLLEAINDHRIDDRVLRGLKVTAGGVTVINDNKGVEKAIRDKQEPEYYEQGHFVNKIIKKGDTLKLHIRAKSFSK